MSSAAAFVYDFLLVEGGAEKTALHVQKAFPAVDLVVGFVDRRVFPATRVPGTAVRTLTSPSRIRGWQGLKVMSAFKRRGGFLDSYESVVFSGVYCPTGVRHRPGGRNLYYCHTPPRFVYDLRAHYLATAPPWQAALIRALIPRVRREFEAAMASMDVIIANSENVRRRLRDHLGLREVRVIHPPVATDRYRWRGHGEYFLSTARLEPYKRVDLVIRAFKQMPDRQLVVASGGSQLEALQRLAAGHDNIRFTGWCGEDRLRELVGRCTATLYLPRDEDFGMSPVESMAAGKPVIGVREGGLIETVIPGSTGWLLDPGDLQDHAGAIEALCAAVAEADSSADDLRLQCESRAALFSAKAFERRFADLLEGADE